MTNESVNTETIEELKISTIDPNAPAMARIPKYLNKYFQANSFVLAYPVQAGMNEGTRYLT